MPPPSHRIALLVALAFGTAASPGFAATPYDPTARAIDAICDAYVSNAAARDVVHLARVEAIGTVPGWHGTDSASIAAAQATAVAGDYATVTFDRGGAVTSTLVEMDAQGAPMRSRTWCFIGGKLSRATVESIDVAAHVGWTRTAYYGDDLVKPLSDYVVPLAAPNAPDPHAKPPTEPLRIDAFATPAKLPWIGPAQDAYAPPKVRR